MNKTLILVVEDDRPIRNLIVTTLKTHDYKYLAAENGASAILEASSHNPDIVLLDLGLPDMEGVEVIKKIRTWSNMPIIVISARSEDTDKIEALDAGADDYIIKPFSNMELIARIKALIRRREIYDQKHMDEKLMNESVECCGVKVYINQNKVEVDGKSVKLTRKEYEILKLLIRYPDKVFTTENIYESVWGDMYTSISGNTIMVHVKNLRSKLSKVCGDIVIATVWGRGYKFER